MQTGEPPPGRRVQVALAAVAGVVLLVTGRMVLRRAAGDPPLLVVSPTPQEILVHVAGEVLVPGVYRLPSGARWSDALGAARGPTFLADLNAINLAQTLRDGDRVFIPRVPEPVVSLEPEETAIRPAGERPPPPRQTVVDVNNAAVADLDALPGIGPVLAARIVEYRRTHGRFERVEDLLEVAGVGPRLLERLRPYLRVR